MPWCDCENPIAVWKDIAWINSKDAYTLVNDLVEWDEEHHKYNLDSIIDTLAACYEVDREEILLWSLDYLAYKDIFTEDIYKYIFGEKSCGAYCFRCRGKL